MVRIDRVVTRGGDAGETSLGYGSRVPKHGARACAIGDVDEANAAIGWLIVVAPDHAPLLRSIQNTLFDLGADLCVPGTGGDRLRLTDAPTLWLERAIFTQNARLPPLHSFVLPGGTEAAARAHLARTVVRRAERAVVRVAGAEVINPALLRYLNRLSDFLFVLARVLNRDGTTDILWCPGAPPTQDGSSDHVEEVQEDDDRDGDPKKP